MPRNRRPLGQLISLFDARVAKRVEVYREKLSGVLRKNRGEILGLYSSGQLFTPEGTRNARNLLKTHEQLLKVVGLLDRCNGTGDVPAPRRQEEIDSIFSELDSLLG